MAYVSFVNTTPNPATQAVGACFNSTRQNLVAMRDAVVVSAMAGWDLTTSGTPSQPDTVYFAEGTETLKIALTWATGGGAAGNVSQAIYSYRATATAAYDTIGTMAVTYATDGSVISTTWS